ncbi:MAG TPA: hypothetical protein VG992_04300 [Candidatus Saccharimonadales bacterium]|nr:hypothetical protein [Candidatus Saccharimonadales bacterium]
MSKTKRDKAGKYAPRHSTRYIIGLWVAAILSVGLLYALGHAVLSDAASLRPCSTNSSGLRVVNCGKAGVGVADLAVIALFILSACLTISLCTAAWRASRRSS